MLRTPRNNKSICIGFIQKIRSTSFLGVLDISALSATKSNEAIRLLEAPISRRTSTNQRSLSLDPLQQLLPDHAALTLKRHRERMIDVDVT